MWRAGPAGGMQGCMRRRERGGGGKEGREQEEGGALEEVDETQKELVESRGGRGGGRQGGSTREGVLPITALTSGCCLYAWGGEGRAEDLALQTDDQYIIE